MWQSYKRQDFESACFLAITPRKRLPFRQWIAAKFRKVLYQFGLLSK